MLTLQNNIFAALWREKGFAASMDN